MGDFMQALARIVASGGNPSQRIEPMMGAAPRGTEAEAQGTGAVERALAPGARAEPTVSGETAHAFGTEAVDQAMDDYSIEAWKNRMLAARNAKRAGKAGEAAVSKAVQPTRAEEKSMTQAWVDRMRAAREAKRATPLPSPEVQLQGQKPWTAEDEARTGVPKYLVDQFGPPPPPMTDAEETRWHGEKAIEHELSRPDASNDITKARAGKAGASAVGEALEGYNPLDWQTALREAIMRNMTPGQLGPPANDMPFAPFSSIDMPESRLPGVSADVVMNPQGFSVPQPMPMTPPGTTFGPHSVVNPEMESTQPTQDDTVQGRRNWIRSQGESAVERGLEE